MLRIPVYLWKSEVSSTAYIVCDFLFWLSHQHGTKLWGPEKMRQSSTPTDGSQVTQESVPSTHAEKALVFLHVLNAVQVQTLVLSAGTIFLLSAQLTVHRVASRNSDELLDTWSPARVHSTSTVSSTGRKCTDVLNSGHATTCVNDTKRNSNESSETQQRKRKDETYIEHALKTWVAKYELRIKHTLKTWVAKKEFRTELRRDYRRPDTGITQETINKETIHHSWQLSSQHRLDVDLGSHGAKPSFRVSYETPLCTVPLHSLKYRSDLVAIMALLAMFTLDFAVPFNNRVRKIELSTNAWKRKLCMVCLGVIHN